MVNFEIKGSAKHVRKQEIRAMLHATATILEYHKHTIKIGEWCNQNPDEPPVLIVKVIITNSKKSLGTCEKAKGVQAVGSANRKKARIKLAEWRKFDSMFTTCIHEVIHLFFPFPNDRNEKLTSTLTAKLKPFIVPLYEALINQTQTRAAILAHRDISYAPKNEPDHYDESQYKVIASLKSVKSQ